MFPMPRDEAELLSYMGEKIYIYECSTKNQKITYAHDFLVNNNQLSVKSKIQSLNLRIGVGEDSHRFSKNFDLLNPVVLGGVKFLECEKSFEANSDGDVVFHSLCNALLSSIGEKTLDSFSDKMCKSGITDSREYVRKSLEIIYKKFPKFKILNVVISLEALIPKITHRHDKIQENVAKILAIEKNQVGLMYTTGEELSVYGKGIGVKCLVEVLVALEPIKE